MLEYARWKYVLVIIVLVASLFFALPNFFGEDLAVQVAREDRAPVDPTAETMIEKFLDERGIRHLGGYVDEGRLMLRFPSDAEQLKARDSINEAFSKQYVSALAYAPRAPELLRNVGLRPMPLGLDLRGGLYLLYEVDVNGAVAQLLEGYEQDARRLLTREKLPFTDVSILAIDSPIDGLDNAFRVLVPSSGNVDTVRDALLKAMPELTFTTGELGTGTAVTAVLTPTQIRERQDFAIEQNITTLRNRVNELGVSEPIVVRQGLNRINVQLPGVQNSAEVKDILGKVATLEFRLEDTQHSAIEAAQRGRAPLGTKLYHNTPRGQPVLLKRDIIVTGDQLTDAIVAATNEGPGVSVKLDARGGEEMLKTTRSNLNRPMAVVFIEQRRETVEVGGQKVERTVKDERIISIATIRGVFSNNFQITGLLSSEARELALLLRAGALAAPLDLVEERAIGPTLGKEHIKSGIRALIIGMIGIFAFMVVSYRMFGIVACLVLLSNLILMMALLSGLRAALTLPGIAGIVLTLGMAVDANVLIYERIREELRRGTSPQAAIRAGFEKAFSAIADANVTTLIAGVVLWMFGTGPIRGFAVTLCVGIATSMFTAIMGSRALLTLMYGGRRKMAALPI
jgi:preprotein translocase subunit SecD